MTAQKGKDLRQVLGTIGARPGPGRAHLVRIKPLGKGLMLSILRYAHEVRPAEACFERISAEPEPEAVKLAAELMKAQSGDFEPKTMPNELCPRGARAG